MKKFDDVFEEIDSILKDNGSVTQLTKDRLILIAIKAIHAKVEIIMDAVNIMTKRQNEMEECQEKLSSQMEKRIENLERNSIMMWINKHPALAAITFVAFILLVSNSNEFVRIILMFAGYPNAVP